MIVDSVDSLLSTLGGLTNRVESGEVVSVAVVTVDGHGGPAMVAWNATPLDLLRILHQVATREVQNMCAGGEN